MMPDRRAAALRYSVALYATESATALPLCGVFDLMRQPAAIEAAAARFQNRRDEDGVVDRRQSAAEISRRRQAGSYLLDRIDECLDAAIAVARLAGKISLGIGRVLHEQRIRRREAARVGGQRIAAVGLIDLHFALLAEVIKPLLRMDVALRRDPTGRVKRRGQRAAFDVFPLRAERDRIFGVDSLRLSPRRSTPSP